MSNLEPVITVKIGDYPLPIYRLPDGRRGVITESDVYPSIKSVDEGIRQWLKMAQMGDQECIEFIDKCLRDGIGASEEIWRYEMAEDILERALADDKNAIRELRHYVLEAIDQAIDEYNWLETLEDAQKTIREKDAF